MRDKFDIQTLYVISNRDWNEIVRKQYDVPKYDFWDDNEADRDGTYQFTVRKRELSRWDLDDLKKFKDGQASFMTNTILTDLCNQNLIDEGEYLINEIGG